MTIIRTFFDLDNSDKILMLNTFFYSYFVRILISILPFQYVLKISKYIGDKKSIKPVKVKKIIWSINCTDNLILKSTCLTKAITAQILLNQNNYHPILKIGVLKNKKFEAHAWVQIDGKVVIGEYNSKFVSILDK